MRTFAILSIVALGLTVPGMVSAQQAESEFLPDYAKAVLTGEPSQSDIQQVECSSCGTMRPLSQRSSGCASCGGVGGVVCSDGCQSGLCKPGRNCKWTGNCGNGFFDTLFGGLGECLCCPDPCYEPVWVTTANAALFQDTVRPKTYTRFRYDSFRGMSTPRIAEYFMSSKGPGNRPIDANELSMYQEVAADRASFFTEMPYRSIEFADGMGGYDHHSGFGDLTLGTKSLLLDCELLQFTFQFKTFIPTAAASNGLGTGHVSLEPSFLIALKLFDATYLQSQIAYWIPIGGNQDWNGPITHYHLSLNHLFLERGPWQVIGTAEFNGWTFSHGLADDVPVEVSAASKTYANVGPGIRISYCENYDIGFGYAHSITEQNLGQNWYRTELRIRY